MCGAEATTTIKRSDWGMKYGIPKAVGDEVKITLPIEAYKE
jgi:polyisoprenoid-binding protein YceI